MKIAVSKPKPRAPKPPNAYERQRPKPTSDLWWCSFQPPSLAEWAAHILEHPEHKETSSTHLDQPAALAGENKQPHKHIHNTSIQTRCTKMSFNVTVGGVPAGAYMATLESIENKSGDFGPSLLYDFTVIGTKYDGQNIGRFTPLPKDGNAGAEFLAGIIGATATAGTDWDLDAFIGRKYHIIVKPSPKSGKLRVETVILEAESAT